MEDSDSDFSDAGETHTVDAHEQSAKVNSLGYKSTDFPLQRNSTILIFQGNSRMNSHVEKRESLNMQMFMIMSANSNGRSALYHVP